MQLQMLTGQQNVNDRLEASKLKVRNGGKINRRRLRNITPPTFLQGNNLDFKVTDGGYAMPVGSTPEGYNLFELRGNDHEHYHKTKGGKNKTGVGIKFADGNVVEGEGNQNTNQGEYLLQTPDAAYFISRHNIDGFNPAQAVNYGMHPLQAYAIQENKKAIKGITDDGKKLSSPIKKRKLAGGIMPDVNTMYMQNTPDMAVDTTGGIVGGTAYVVSKMKCGGKHRKKAETGYEHWYSNKDSYRIVPWNANINNTIAPKTDSIIIPYKAGTFTNTPISISDTFKTTLPNKVSISNNTINNKPSVSKSNGNFWSNIGTDLIGAGISSLGNIGGAIMATNANRYAGKTLANAYRQSADIMADAYRSLRTVDMNSIKRQDFRASHAMPALQAPISQAAAQLAVVDRGLQRRLSNAGKYSASGAAAQARMDRAEIEAQDMKNKIYSEDQRQMQAIRQANAERVSQAAIENARLDMQSNNDYTNAYLNLLQYNNDIENQKILGAAGALSEGSTMSANAISNAHTANGAAWSQAVNSSAQGFANTLSTMAARKADLQKVLLGASGDTQTSYYAQYGTDREARDYYNNLISQYNIVKNSNNVGDKETADILKRRINNIATKRGFAIV